MDTKEKIAVMQDQLAVMQAFVDGKTIQCRTKTPDNRHAWLNMSIITPQWQWSDTEYRVKPEPEVLYVNERKAPTGYSYAYPSLELAKNGATGYEERYSYIGKKFVAVEE